MPEGNILFNVALNTFYLWLCGVNVSLNALDLNYFHIHTTMYSYKLTLLNPKCLTVSETQMHHTFKIVSLHKDPNKWDW